MFLQFALCELITCKEAHHTASHWKGRLSLFSFLLFEAEALPLGKQQLAWY